MISAFVYLGIMLATILIWFSILKRPIYEAVLISFIIMVTIGGKWGHIGSYFVTGMSTSLLYSMTVFVAMSIVLTKTKIIDGAIEIILALLGRIPGGAGYVSVIASSFMGALSGSGPGNVMATGTITIPTMKRSGFPAHLAGNIESASSCLGNMIPPSSNIVAALGVITALYPKLDLSIGKFWIICWGCSIWFIIHRLVMVFSFCKYYKVKSIPKDQLPKLKTTIKEGWRGLLLPVIILVPFILDYFFKSTFYTSRLGETGAEYFSSSLLFFIAGIATIYAMIVVKDKRQVKLSALARMFSENVKSIVPVIAVCLFGYMFGALFTDMNISEGLEQGISMLNMGKLGTCILIPLITGILGIAIVGSSMIVVFGPVFVSIFASVGVDPILATAMLPCICGVMSNMVPPIAPAFLAGVTLADANFGKAVKNGLWWIFTCYIIEVVVLMGLLPILGL